MLPASQDTLVQILKKQPPYDQSQHHSPACKCKAFSTHISFFHKASSPVKEGKVYISILSIAIESKY